MATITLGEILDDLRAADQVLRKFQYPHRIVGLCNPLHYCGLRRFVVRIATNNGLKCCLNARLSIERFLYGAPLAGDFRKSDFASKQGGFAKTVLRAATRRCRTAGIRR